MSPSLPETVLVTGGAGLVGASVVRALLAEGARVVVLDDRSGGARLAPPADPRVRDVHGDVRDAALLEELLRGEPRVTAVVHLAARVGVRTVLSDPEGAARANRAGALALVEALAALPPERRPRVLAASSSEVYADGAAPLSEDSPVRVAARGRWAYAASKLAAERLFDRLLEARTGAPAGAPAPTHLRFFNVTGPGQDAASGMVLPRFVEAARAGAPLEVHGDGQQVRTFAHVEDVARDVAQLALGRVAAPGPLNLGGEARTTILALALLVADAAARRGLPRPAVVHVDPTRAVAPGFADVRHRVPDLGRARALGLARRARPLPEIVEDVLARHRAPAAAVPPAAHPADHTAGHPAGHPADHPADHPAAAAP